MFGSLTLRIHGLDWGSMICIKSCFAAIFADFVVFVVVSTVAEGDGLMRPERREVHALEEQSTSEYVRCGTTQMAFLPILTG